MATITLKRPAKCKDCGADLPAGSRARYYGRGQIYGTECHENPREERLERALAGRERREARRAQSDPIAPQVDGLGSNGFGHRDPGEDAEDRWNESQRGGR